MEWLFVGLLVCETLHVLWTLCLSRCLDAQGDWMDDCNTRLSALEHPRIEKTNQDDLKDDSAA